jgi:hypothetical protein
VGLPALEFRFRRGKQDAHIGDQFRLAGDNHHRVVLDRKESAVCLRQNDSGVGVDSNIALSQNAEKRLVPGQNAQFAFDGASDEHARLARPDLAVCGDDMNLERGHD